jgi:hypothetical protein
MYVSILIDCGGATEICYAKFRDAFQLERILSFLHIVGLESLHWLIGPFVAELSGISC